MATIVQSNMFVLYCFLLLLTVSIGSSSILQGCLAWQEILPTSNRQNQRHRYNYHHGRSRSSFSQKRPLQIALFSTSSSSSVGSSSPSLEGVGDFESWFSEVDGSKCNPYIKHTSFGDLRGLGTLDRSIGSNDSGSWMTIPRSITLESDFSQTDWDAKLAETLWKEVVKGSGSSIKGYVSLLTKSWTTNQLPEAPPFTAPDALRHWTETEKEALAIHPEGRALLDLQRRQEQTWREKYEVLKSQSAQSMTWEQFEWAMEAVHSRAFCGDFGIGGGSSLPTVVTAGAPFVSALLGYIYFAPLHGQNDAVLFVLAALGSIPSIVNLLKSSPPVAVMLPLIDSANHLEEADSSIEYSPFTDSFDLTGGSQCLVQDEDGGKQQLYISYGKKSDKELLLNYGFLKGTFYKGEDQTERRKQLAERFVANQ